MTLGKEHVTNKSTNKYVTLGNNLWLEFYDTSCVTFTAASAAPIATSCLRFLLFSSSWPFSFPALAAEAVAKHIQTVKFDKENMK